MSNPSPEAVIAQLKHQLQFLCRDCCSEWKQGGPYIHELADGTKLRKNRMNGVCECGYSQNGHELKQALEAAIRKVTMFTDRIQQIVKSEGTPLFGSNNESYCFWCEVEWAKPDWRLDPQPDLFGHPRNHCLVWEGFTSETNLSAEQDWRDKLW
jgi:hypothetical protein